MSSRKVVRQRIGATAGLLAPILAFACIISAVASYPAFSWTNNALSDLGVVRGVTGPLFNFGLYTSGLLGFIFALFGLPTYVGKSFWGKIGTLTFSAATVALIAIGVFNESFSGIHYAVSVAFFILVPVSLFIIAYAFVLVHQTQMAILTVGIGIVMALPWITFFAFRYVPNVAIPETISALAVSTWTIILSYLILKKTKS
ncbi:MAG TPA: DUF998 domain-containing protein [Candidatus Limnocylindrales bacterium]|nr:DUF998 domain-containing protein [Candidatus Limnocylindrales bacterium]